MSTFYRKWSALIPLVLLLVAPAARAQFAVIDVAAIVQDIQEVQTLEQELETAQKVLSQAKSQYDSMTGGRGMERLLSGTNRNYLPGTWDELQATLTGAAGTYGALSASVQGLISSNAVLTTTQMSAFSPAERNHLLAARQNAAALQAVARQALATSSQRFSSLQQLIDTIPSATDEKGILELQSRIAAEQTMLQNEHAKLDVLYQAAQGEELARQQRLREQAIADIGSFRNLPPLGLR